MAIWVWLWSPSVFFLLFGNMSVLTVYSIHKNKHMTVNRSLNIFQKMMLEDIGSFLNEKIRLHGCFRKPDSTFSEDFKAPAMSFYG